MSQGLENVLIHLILASPIGEAARQSFHLSDRRDVKLIKLIYSIKGEKPPSRPIAIEVYENYTNNRLEYLRRFFEEKQITVRDFLQHQEKCGNFNGYFLQFLEINQKILFLAEIMREEKHPIEIFYFENKTTLLLRSVFKNKMEGEEL